MFRSNSRRVWCKSLGTTPAAALEQLEPRTLLAFALTEYFPADPTDSWDYRGTSEGANATAEMTVQGAFNSGAQTDFPLEVHAGFASLTTANRFSRNASGFFLHSQSFESFGETIVINLGNPVRLAAAQVDPGNVFPFSTTFSAFIEGFGTINGNFSGSLTVLNPENVVTPAGTFSALHVRLLANASATVQGETFTSAGAEDWWLARRIGLVRIDNTTTTSGGGETETAQFTLRLTDSTRLALGEIRVLGNNRDITDGDTTPASNDFTKFGSTFVDGAIRTRNYTIRNFAAQGTLFIDGISISGTAAADFAVTRLPSDRSLAPGEETTFRIRFDPTALGGRTATITILTSDVDENPFNFRVRGSGVATPDIALTGNGLAILNGDTTPRGGDHTAFGNVAVTGATRTRLFTIRNTGPGLLTLSGSQSVTISGANAADFSILIQPGGTIGPSAFVVFQVRFDALAAGTRTARISIASDDPDENPFTFDISGVGT